MAQRAPKQAYRFETFKRAARDGRNIVYVRFLDESGRVVATRSTGETEAGPSKAVILRLASELDLDRIAAAKAEGRQADEKASARRSSVSVADFIKAFWTPGSDYLTDRAAAGSPLSGKYIETCQLYARKHIDTWPAFKKTPLREIAFRHVDAFARSLRNAGSSRHVINRTIDALRTPISWATARGLCSPVDFGGLVLPAVVNRERGILTDEEVSKILALPTMPLWSAKDSGALHVDVKPRPRLKEGQKNAGPSPVDIRMKAYVALGLFAGLRRGEERGLRWGSVDTEAGELIIKDNYQEADGLKRPKLRSVGRVPIAPELEPILWELREMARALGTDGPEHFVLMNPSDRTRPVSATSLRRGWERILEAIGIDDAERERRHLVPHGTRHRFATKLLDAGFTPSEAGKLTRQKTQAVVEKYGAHLSAETVEKAHRALRVDKTKGK